MTKDEYASTLRAYQNRTDEMKSDAREIEKAAASKARQRSSDMVSNAEFQRKMLVAVT